MDKRKEEGGMKGLKNFLYNSDTGEACGRTGSSWAQIGLFYLVFYSGLAGFFAIMLALFFTTVNSDYPVQQDLNSLLKGNPGMGFRPQPDIERTLIRFQQGVPSSYQVYTKHIHAYLEKYATDEQKDLVNCSIVDEADRDETKACKFTIDDLLRDNPDCNEATHYGYSEGQPCVLLKANRIYGWEPPLFNSTPPEATGLGDRWHPDYVGVTCEGENPGDVQNIRNMTFSPNLGYHKMYFPYLNQKGYVQPLVFVQFVNVEPSVLIQVTCKLWVEGITHNRNDKAGSIHFELLVD